MNSVWGFSQKSYGSCSWRQIHWPVLMHAETYISSCPLWCVPLPLSQTKGNISAAIKASLGSLWVAVMFLVSCYYTVSSFSRSADVSFKNLYCTGPYWCGLTSSSMKQASAICPPSMYTGSFFKPIYLFSCIHTFSHSVLLISVYKIYLHPPFLDSS